MYPIGKKPLIKVIISSLILLMLLSVYSKIVIERGAFQTFNRAKKLEAASYLSILESIGELYRIDQEDELLSEYKKLSSINKNNFKIWVIDNKTRKVKLNLFNGMWEGSSGESSDNIDLVYSNLKSGISHAEVKSYDDNKNEVISKAFFKLNKKLNWIVGVNIDPVTYERVRKEVKSRVWNNYHMTVLMLTIILIFIMYVTYKEEKKLVETNRDLDRSKFELEKALKREVDELNRTKKHYIESEKMAVLGGLVASFTHDISTPVGGSKTVISDLILNNRDLGNKIESGVLKKSELTDFNENFKNALNIIDNNLDIAISQINSFKSISIDQQTESVERICVEDFINKLLIGATSLCDNGKFVCNYTPKGNSFFVTKPGCLSQVFLNLIVNSITHGFKERNSGEINITTDNRADSLIISYSDNGRGIDPKIIDSIWEPFFTTEKDSGGSGLGLYNVKSLIQESLNGEISLLASEGFSVEISLPTL